MTPLKAASLGAVHELWYKCSILKNESIQQLLGSRLGLVLAKMWRKVTLNHHKPFLILPIAVIMPANYD
ncbi:hypothetical protein [Legionella waltersii]|uniref:hypothetical protein n=1 Tax=Legionella waltersii TaxID=66969 RepID=UPI0007316990|nr:hypothetical protein [Legionella waltersii]